MRVLAVGPDAIVFVSSFWQTTCTAIRAGDEGFVIDSPVYPDELEALPSVLEQAGFPVSGLLATHADWDHLLGRQAFPGASLACAESTVERLSAAPGAAQRELREFDQEHYVQGRRPLSLVAVQSLPVPGRLSLGTQHEIELHPTDGHTPDGAAYLMPWLRVLVCGDYVSPVEIPWVSEGGSIDGYAATLARLRPLLQRVETVVPGHGGPIPRDRAVTILDEDVGYLVALARDGIGAPLPSGRSTNAQRRIHEENAARVSRS